MKQALALVAFLILSGHAMAQTAGWDTLRRNLPSPVVNYSADRKGNLYYTTRMGGVYQMDSLGNERFHFSPRSPAEVSQLEAWQGLKIVLFYREFQQFIYLDRFLTDAPPLRLSDYTNGFVRLLTPSADDRLWLFDELEMQLRKVDPQSGQIVKESPLNLLLAQETYNLVFMREYANQLYLLADNKGVLVFDNLGNYRKTIPMLGYQYLTFYEQNLVFAQEDALLLMDPYTMRERTITAPGLTPDAQIIVVGRNLYWFTEKLLLRRRMG